MSSTRPDILVAPVRLEEDALHVMQSWSANLIEEGFGVVPFDVRSNRIPERAADAVAVLVPCAVFNLDRAGGFPMSPQTLQVIRYAVDRKKALFSEAPLVEHFEASEPAFPSSPKPYRLPGGIEATVIGQDIDIMKQELGVT